jgi:hypothetical protein
VEPAKKDFSQISLGNQKRNFLTVLLPGNTVAPRKFARVFSGLCDQETIEWE